MKLKKSLRMKDGSYRYPIIQAGMGAGVTLETIASEVSKTGCIGTIASVGIPGIIEYRTGEKLNVYESIKSEVEKTVKNGGFAAVNIMVAVVGYEQSIKGALDGGAKMIISGAGIPLDLPNIVENHLGTDHNVNLVPIVSTARSFKILCHAWNKRGYKPDLVILEGPKAGGHLGWRYKDMLDYGDEFLEKNELFGELEKILEIRKQYDNIPIIVAGGILTPEDLDYALGKGADGVQMGTRFSVSKESGFLEEYKRLIINAKKETIVIGNEEWGSPCRYPFRYLTTSPLAIAKAKDSSQKNNSFCICTGLFAAIRNKPLEKNDSPCPEKYVWMDRTKPCSAHGLPSHKAIISCGSDAYRLKEILKNKPNMIMPAADIIEEFFKYKYNNIA